MNNDNNVLDLGEVAPKSQKGRIILGLAIVVALLLLAYVWLPILKGMGHTNEATAAPPARTTEVTQAVSQAATSTAHAPTTDVMDDMNRKVIKGGVNDVRCVLRWLGRQSLAVQKDYLHKLKSLTGYTLKDLRRMADKEKSGANFSAWAPAGTWVVNSYRGSDGKIYFTKPYKLRRGRFVLVDEHGKLWCFMTCGNISKVVRLPKGVKTLRRVRRPKKPPCNPSGLEVGNPTYVDLNSPGSTPGASKAVYDDAKRRRGRGAGTSGEVASGDPVRDEGHSVTSDGKVVVTVPDQTKKEVTPPPIDTKSGDPGTPP